MVAASEQSLVVSHVATAGISIALINWLKKSPWFPWITAEKANIARYVAYLTAAVGAIGIHYTWNPAARTLSFDVPTLASMFAVGVAYVKSFAFQELTYQATKRPNLSELVKAVLEGIGKNPAAPVAVLGQQKQ